MLICGPISTRDMGDYFITFVDDYFRYRYKYLMSHKSKALDKFKEFQTELEKQLGKRIKVL